jgi:chromosome segregation ATPase
MNVNTLTIEQLNRELISRHSRASGTIEARRERLKRFLDFENQKERRHQAVQQVKADKEAEAEMDGQQDEVDTEEEQAVRTLLRLREDIERSEYYINHLIPRMKAVEEAFIDLDESYEVVVGENLRLNQRIDNLELRLSHLENRSESPPPLILPDSNPNWRLDTAMLN